LTETPIEFAKDIRNAHGEYGVAFKKGDIIRSGGMPAVYIIPSLMDVQKLNGGFCNELKPFINILRLKDKTKRKKHDFLFEREWRVDRDIDFDEIHPIGIILSESLSSLYGRSDYIKKLEKYVYEYGEIQIE